MLLFMGACMKMMVEKVTMRCEGKSEVGIRREREKRMSGVEREKGKERDGGEKSWRERRGGMGIERGR